MSLLNLPIGRNRKSSVVRRPRAFRPAMQPYLEGLEPRTVLSGAGTALVSAAVMQSPLSITGINVTNLAATGANTLTATFNLTGQVLGQNFTLHNLQLPVTLTGVTQTPNPTNPTMSCPILHLSLEIPDLNILGLHVRLDNCNHGPVTVDVTAIPSGQTGGGLLGSLLCSVDNLLSGPTGLQTLLGLVDPSTGGNVATELLNGVLGGILSGSGAGAAATPSEPIPAGDCELVDLHLDTINLNLLGLQVTTSPICLNVFADPNGGLLGDLLCSLDNLLNNNGNTGHAQQILVRNFLRDLSQLGL